MKYFFVYDHSIKLVVNVFNDVDDYWIIHKQSLFGKFSFKFAYLITKKFLILQNYRIFILYFNNSFLFLDRWSILKKILRNEKISRRANQFILPVTLHFPFLQFQFRWETSSKLIETVIDLVKKENEEQIKMLQEIQRK